MSDLRCPLDREAVPGEFWGRSMQRGMLLVVPLNQTAGMRRMVTQEQSNFRPNRLSLSQADLVKQTVKQTAKQTVKQSVLQSDLINQLQNQIRGVETAGRINDGVRISSGCAAMDRLLPASGYQRGTLVQWLTGGGQGADYLSLLLAKQACADGGALVVFDPLNQFYPPAAAAIGINLDHLIILRSQQSGDRQDLESDLLWSIDQALRCPAVAAVWGPLDHINERWFRRFQLSAETSGALGLFIQPVRAARQPSWAEVQWMVSHVQHSDDCLSTRL